MYHLLSFIAEDSLLREYRDRDDLENSLAPYVHGLEVVRCYAENENILPTEKIIGVHLPFYSDWLNFWRGDREKLLREFHDEKTWAEFYPGSDPRSLIPYFQKDMDYAREVGAKYVVFHVCQVSNVETLTGIFDYRDEEVIDASAELINLLFQGKNYDFEFLMENLYWPGLNFRDPDLARRLLNRVRYKKKGFMLDTGHMMCSNPSLRSEEEACQYIRTWFSKNPDLIPYVRGIHLHQSVTGEVARKIYANPPSTEGSFYERFARAYELVFQLDTHQIMTAPGTRELIEFLDPEYLTYEFRNENRKEREEKLKKQWDALWKA